MLDIRKIYDIRKISLFWQTYITLEILNKWGNNNSNKTKAENYYVKKYIFL